MSMDPYVYLPGVNVDFKIRIEHLKEDDIPSVYADNSPYVIVRPAGPYICLSITFCADETKNIYLLPNEVKGLRKALKKMNKRLEKGG